MSRTLSFNSLPRGIFDVFREIRMLTSPHHPPASENRTLSPLRLPDVWAPSQYLLNMGLRPALARRLSSVYMDIVTRYRQVFESYFRCAIGGSCHLNPDHYRDIFVVHFRGTIQVLASRMVSTAWVWLCQAGLPLAFSRSQHIDVRVDTVTKAQILSRLGLKTTSSIMDATSNRIELPEEECKTGGNFPTKTLPASVPSPLRSTTLPTRDLFHSEKPSTCFPACYPPPPSEPISSPLKTLVTQFKLTPSAKNKKPFANCSVDVSSLTALFGKMSVPTSKAGLKTEEHRKCTLAPRSKKPEPLPPLLVPVVASVSGSPQKPQSPSTDVVLSAKSTTAPRRRRIAALPTRHNKTTALLSIDLSSPATNSLVSAPASDNFMLHTPPSRVAKTTVTEGTSIDCVTSYPATVQYRPPSRARCTAGTPDNLGSKVDLFGRRKRLPFPRKVSPQLQAPSLVSDSPSCADSSSSSDEFDTPPSTPPSHSHSLTTCNTSATSFASSKSNTTGPFRQPMITTTNLPDPGTREGVQITFINGDAVGEREFRFTFGA